MSKQRIAELVDCIWNSQVAVVSTACAFINFKVSQ